MSSECEYFSSDHWTTRIHDHLDEVWDITDFFGHVDTKESPEKILSKYVESTDGINEEKLIKEPLSRSLSRDWNVSVKTNIAHAVETWEKTTGFHLPDSCPHETHEDNYCIFHMAVENKDDAAVKTEFLSVIEGESLSYFFGARFGDLRIPRQLIEGHSRQVIDCRFVTIRGVFDLTGSTVRNEIDLYGAQIYAPECKKAEFHEDINCMWAKFGRATRFESSGTLSGNEYEFSDYYAEFAGEITFAGAAFHGKADFKRVHFGGDTSFNNVVFEAVAVFNYATFDGQGDFMHSVFERKADFSKSIFTDYAIFYTIFHMKAVFNYTSFEAEADFWSAEFNGMTDFWVTNFSGDADFRHVDFYEYTSFRETNFSKRADFSGVEFHDDVRFDRVTTRDEPITLHEARLAGGHITQPSTGRCRFDFEEATIGDVRLDNDQPDQLLEDFRFVETDFNGFDFARHREALTDSWSIHTHWDSELISSDRLESTYLRAKNGANQVGDSKGASEFFLQEMKYRRRRYATQSSWGRWMINWFFNLSCGYGERPLRTVGSSFGLIVFFAGVYWASGVSLSYSEDPLSYLVFSLQSFVTLILGGVNPSRPTLIRLAAAFEAFIGAFFIALFVFSLTRTIHR